MKLLNSISEKQVTYLDLLKAYMAANYPDRTIVVLDICQWEEEEVEKINKLFGRIEGYISFSYWEIACEECVLLEVSVEMATAMLSIAYDDKWGLGSCFYLWHENEITWGRE